MKDVSEFDTLDEYKADIRKEREKSKASRAENAMKNKVIEKVFEANDIDVPDVMVESEIDNMISEFDQQLRSQGLDLNTYMQYLGKDPKEMRDELKDEAFKKTKTRMIVSEMCIRDRTYIELVYFFPFLLGICCVSIEFSYWRVGDHFYSFRYIHFSFLDSQAVNTQFLY